MFVNNKYYRWYLNICENAKNRVKGSPGFERHHVIPKSMGGDNKIDNVRLLTYREHYIAHWLLTKCTDGLNRHKMLNALWRMVHVPNSYKRVVASWQYAIAKKAASEALSLRSKGNTYAKGRKVTEKELQALRDRKGFKMPESAKEKLRQSRLGKNRSEESRKKQSLTCLGKKMDDEVKLKIGMGNKGKVRSEGMKEKLRLQRLGKKASDETRAKMREAHRVRFEAKRARLKEEGVLL